MAIKHLSFQCKTNIINNDCCLDSHLKYYVTELLWWNQYIGSDVHIFSGDSKGYFISDFRLKLISKPDL